MMSVRNRAILVLAFLAGGYFLAFTSWPLHLPSTCMFKRMTGLPCIGCNMTHACCALAGGHVFDAINYHIGVVPFALAIIGVAMVLAMELVANRPLIGDAWKRSRRVVLWGSTLVFLAGWAINLVRIVHG